MKYIDTHCHLQFSQFDEDRAEILTHCKEQEIGVINVGCDYESSKGAIALAETSTISNLWATVGQHPTDTDEVFNQEAFLALATSSRTVVGIGECGLDYYHLPEDPLERPGIIERQKDLLYAHLNLADETHLPLVIHCRDAHEDMIAILSDRYTMGGVMPVEGRGVMHCFTGTWEHARAYLDLGFYLSFTGVITFADQYDAIVANAPQERILIETDAPYLTPAPHRGKKNGPQYVHYTAERIAAIRGVTKDEILEITKQNAARLFHL